MGNHHSSNPTKLENKLIQILENKGVKEESPQNKSLRNGSPNRTDEISEKLLGFNPNNIFEKKAPQNLHSSQLKQNLTQPDRHSDVRSQRLKRPTLNSSLKNNVDSLLFNKTEKQELESITEESVRTHEADHNKLLHRFLELDENDILSLHRELKDEINASKSEFAASPNKNTLYEVEKFLEKTKLDSKDTELSEYEVQLSRGSSTQDLKPKNRLHTSENDLNIITKSVKKEKKRHSVVNDLQIPFLNQLQTQVRPIASQIDSNRSTTSQPNLKSQRSVAESVQVPLFIRDKSDKVSKLQKRRRVSIASNQKRMPGMEFLKDDSMSERNDMLNLKLGMPLPHHDQLMHINAFEEDKSGQKLKSEAYHLSKRSLSSASISSREVKKPTYSESASDDDSELSGYQDNEPHISEVNRFSESHDAVKKLEEELKVLEDTQSSVTMPSGLPKSRAGTQQIVQCSKNNGSTKEILTKVSVTKLDSQKVKSEIEEIKVMPENAESNSKDDKILTSKPKDLCKASNLTKRPKMIPNNFFLLEEDQGVNTAFETQQIYDGVYSPLKYPDFAKYSKECDLQQRIGKQNDPLSTRANRVAQDDQASSFRISQVLEIDDFKSFLNLISDLQVVHVNQSEILLNNNSMDIVIHKDKFVESLFDIGESAMENSQAVWQKKKDNLPVTQKENSTPVNYFPFNPSFETSEVLKRRNSGFDERIFDNVEEDEQDLILKLIESANQPISTHTSANSHPSTSSHPPRIQLTNCEPQSSVTLEDFLACDIDLKMPNLNELTPINEENTPMTIDDTPIFEVAELESNHINEQGDLKLSRNSSNKNSSLMSPRIVSIADLYDAEFFDKDIVSSNKMMSPERTMTIATPVSLKSQLPVKEIKKPLEEKKSAPFDFSALDDMGDILDSDLTGELNQEEYISTLIPTYKQPRANSKTITLAKDYTPIPFESTSNLDQKAITQQNSETPKIDDFFTGSFGKVDSKFDVQEVDPFTVGFKNKTKSQLTQINAFSFSNSQSMPSIQSLNTQQ